MNDKEYLEEIVEKKHYVNNRELFESLVLYREKLSVTEAAGLERPPMPEEVSSAILRICTKLSRMHNFIGYSYRNDMISDAILQVTAKFHKFDPTKSENPFAYFSQIAWQSFVGRIKEEQKQASIRARLINDKVTTEFVDNLENDTEASNAFVDFLKENEIFVDYFEQHKTQNQTGAMHPSLKHRNLTPYAKKPVKVANNPETNLYELTDE